MAIIKFTNSKSSLKNIINYITKEEKTNTNLITGKDCMAQTALEEMMSVKEVYNKKEGRQYIHLIQSFSLNDNIDYEKAHQIGIELANYFKGFQVLVATHTDTEHIHNHLVLNSVNFETGKKFNQSKSDMKKVKAFSDELCESAGISVIKANKYKGIYKRNEYQVALKGESWKMRLINAIDYSLENSASKTDFFKQMNKLGYQVVWTQNKKYITYTTPEGMKCRDNKLNDKKYLKEEMENAIERRFKENEQNTNTRWTGGNSDTSGTTIYVNESRGSKHISRETQGSNRYAENYANYGGKGAKRIGEEYSIFRRKINSVGGKDSLKYGGEVYKNGERYSKGKVGFQKESDCNSNNSRNSSGIDSKVISLVAIGILVSMPTPNYSKRRMKIRGWKKNLSKRARIEWYLRNKNSSSVFADEEEEWEM